MTLPVSAFVGSTCIYLLTVITSGDGRFSVGIHWSPRLNKVTREDRSALPKVLMVGSLDFSLVNRKRHWQLWSLVMSDEVGFFSPG